VSMVAKRQWPANGLTELRGLVDKELPWAQELISAERALTVSESLKYSEVLFALMYVDSPQGRSSALIDMKCSQCKGEYFLFLTNFHLTAYHHCRLIIFCLHFYQSSSLKALLPLLCSRHAQSTGCSRLRRGLSQRGCSRGTGIAFVLCWRRGQCRPRPTHCSSTLPAGRSLAWADVYKPSLRSGGWSSA